jgi:hypothetical protein
MSSHPEIIVPVLVGLATVGVGIGVLSLRRRRRCRRLCSLAAEATGRGQRAEALDLLSQAEQSWALNSHDGSRRSILADLGDFAGILDHLVRLRPDLTAGPPMAHARHSLESVRSLFSERGNFGIDGRVMKREAAARWAQLSGEFESARQALRRELARLKVDADASPNGGPATRSGNAAVREGPPSLS